MVGRKQHGTIHYTAAEIIAMVGALTSTSKGVCQTLKATADMHNPVATGFSIARCYSQDVLVESVVINSRLNLSDDANFTGVLIMCGVTTNVLFSNTEFGAKAHLTVNNSVTWEGVTLLKAGEDIFFNIFGGSADADPSIIDVYIKYRAMVDGGYLA